MSDTTKENTGNGSQSNTANTSSNTTTHTDGAVTTPNGGGDNGKAYTQAELDRMFSERAAQARRAAEKELLEGFGVKDVDDLKTALARLKEIEDAQLDAKEKLERDLEAERQRAADAEKRAEEHLASLTTQRLMNAVFAEATKQNFADPNDAWALSDTSKFSIGDDGTVTGVEDVVKKIAEEKPYLLNAAKAAPTGGTPRKMTKLIEKNESVGTPATGRRVPVSKF